MSTHSNPIPPTTSNFESPIDDKEEYADLFDFLSPGYVSEQKEENPKACQVCGDDSHGFHYGAFTCEGCMNFYRWHSQKELKPVCPYDKKCFITKSSQKSCWGCKWERCLELGMKSNRRKRDNAFLAYFCPDEEMNSHSIQSTSSYPNQYPSDPVYGPVVLQENPQIPNNNLACAICGDKNYKGYHYGVLTCDRCRAFFRHHYQKEADLVCRKIRQCFTNGINKETRNYCPRCRMDKCLEMGMRGNQSKLEAAPLVNEAAFRPDQGRPEMNNSYSLSEQSTSNFPGNYEDHVSGFPIHAPIEERLEPVNDNLACAICGENEYKIGCNYGVLTCKACRVFFIRKIHAKETLQCKNNNKCVINERTRKSCQKCRLEKCLKMGMNYNLRKITINSKFPIPADQYDNVTGGAQNYQYYQHQNQNQNPENMEYDNLDYDDAEYVDKEYNRINQNQDNPQENYQYQYQNYDNLGHQNIELENNLENEYYQEYLNEYQELENL